MGTMNLCSGEGKNKKIKDIGVHGHVTSGIGQQHFVLACYLSYLQGYLLY